MFLEDVWLPAEACHSICGAVEAFSFLAVARHYATTVAPNLRRRILTPQLWRDFVLGVAVAATAFPRTKQQPHNWWPPQSVVWLASAGTKHQPSSRWQPHVWRGARRPAPIFYNLVFLRKFRFSLL